MSCREKVVKKLSTSKSKYNSHFSVHQQQGSCGKYTKFLVQFCTNSQISVFYILKEISFGGGGYLYVCEQVLERACACACACMCASI